MFNWIIEQALSNLPTWFWPFVAGAGFAGYLIAGIASHIIQLKVYAMILRVISFIAFTVGVFMCGGSGVTAIYKAQIQEMEQKVAIAQQASDDANTRLNDALTQHKTVIHNATAAVDAKIKRNTVKLDTECHLDPTADRILNEAAKNPLKK